jgi:hypothetical protein
MRVIADLENLDSIYLHIGLVCKKEKRKCGMVVVLKYLYMIICRWHLPWTNALIFLPWLNVHPAIEKYIKLKFSG